MQPLSPVETACNVESRGSFAGMPPTTNDETTNSFLYCPLRLHAADVLPTQVVDAWTMRSLGLQLRACICVFSFWWAAFDAGWNA